MAVVGRNILRDASFEVSTLADGFYWTITNAVAVGSLADVAEVESWDGDRSVQLIDLDFAAVTGFKTAYDINFQEGTTWTFSLYVTAFGIQSSINIGVLWDDATTTEQNIVVTTGTWQRKTFTFTVPAGKTFGTPFVTQGLPNTGGHVRIDAVQLEPGSEATEWMLAREDRVEGSMVTEDMQYEFNGCLLGHGTDFIVTEVQGLLGMPGISSDDVDNIADHGAVAGAMRMGKRVIPMDVTAVGGRVIDIEGKVDWLRKCFRPPSLRNSRTVHMLTFKRPGKPKQIMFARCDRRDIPSTAAVLGGKATSSLQFVATDPVIYSYDMHEKSLTLPIGATSGDIPACYNLGDHEDGVRPLIVIQGPCSDPEITSYTDDGRELKFLDLDVDAGDSLEIDLYSKSVTYVTGLGVRTDAFLYLTNDSKWLVLLPGANRLEYERAAGNTGATSTITVYWRDGWS